MTLRFCLELLGVFYVAYGYVLAIITGVKIGPAELKVRHVLFALFCWPVMLAALFMGRAMSRRERSPEP